MYCRECKEKNLAFTERCVKCNAQLPFADASTSYLWGFIACSLLAILFMLSKNPFAGPNIKVVVWFLVFAAGSYAKYRQAKFKEESEHQPHEIEHS